MCVKCYHKSAEPRPCVKCHVIAQIHARGMCQNCWRHEYSQTLRPKRQCINVVTEIHGHDMCDKCHFELYYEDHEQQPKVKERRILYYRRRNHQPQIKERAKMGYTSYNWHMP